jgi:hypothetical protein
MNTFACRERSFVLVFSEMTSSICTNWTNDSLRCQADQPQSGGSSLPSANRMKCENHAVDGERSSLWIGEAALAVTEMVARCVGAGWGNRERTLVWSENGWRW